MTKLCKDLLPFLTFRITTVVGKKNRTKKDTMKMILRYLSMSTRRFFEKSVFQGGNQTFVVTSTSHSRRSAKETKNDGCRKLKKHFLSHVV